VIHAAGTAIFHDAFEIDVSMLVGTELPGAAIVSVFVVLPFTKFTFTCGILYSPGLPARIRAPTRSARNQLHVMRWINSASLV